MMTYEQITGSVLLSSLILNEQVLLF